MELNALIERLRAMEKAKDEAWLKSLPKRKIDEIEHHNLQRDQKIKSNLAQDTFELLHGNKKFYSTIELSDRYMRAWLSANVVNKVFLDFACGNGGEVIQAATSGAALAIGIDLSDVSIRNARAAAQKAGVADRCVFIQGDCENTELPDECIDVILCSGVLHHMDLTAAFPEMKRILKTGGVALALEALNYNPVIKLYRAMTPSMRTEWEKGHILSMKEVRYAKQFFHVDEIRFWHLFSIFAAYLRNQDWFFKSAMRAFNRIDNLLLKLPGIRLMAWQFTFVMQKKATA